MAKTATLLVGRRDNVGYVVRGCRQAEATDRLKPVLRGK
jgi:hypothetical protein